MGKSMDPRLDIRLRVGVILFSAHNHPSHCYIRTQPFPNVMAAVGTFLAAFLSALARATMPLAGKLISPHTTGFKSALSRPALAASRDQAKENEMRVWAMRRRGFQK